MAVDRKAFHYLHAAIHKAGDIVLRPWWCEPALTMCSAMKPPRRPKGLHGSAGDARAVTALGEDSFGEFEWEPSAGWKRNPVRCAEWQIDVKSASVMSRLSVQRVFQPLLDGFTSSSVSSRCS